MPWTPQQHLNRASFIDEKAKAEREPKKKHRLEGLALAHRLVARMRAEREKACLSELEDHISENTYRQALPHLKAGVAHLAGNGADLPTMVRALIKHLSSAGMDANTIRKMKPFIWRFTQEVLPAASVHALKSCRVQAIRLPNGTRATTAACANPAS